MPYCESSDEIKEYLKNKALQITYNSQSYDPNSYGDKNPIKNTLNTQWILMDFDSPSVITNRL